MLSNKPEAIGNNTPQESRTKMGWRERRREPTVGPSMILPFVFRFSHGVLRRSHAKGAHAGTDDHVLRDGVATIVVDEVADLVEHLPHRHIVITDLRLLLVVGIVEASHLPPSDDH